MDTYEKKYNEALKRAKAAIDIAADKDLVKGVATTIFPELRESEDERMMREFNDWLCEEIECRTNDLRDEKDRRTLNMLCYVLTKFKDWLEKQKEPHYTKRNALFDKCVENCDPEVRKEVSNKVDEMLGKDQKPAWSEEDIDKMVNEMAKKSGTTKTEMQFYRQGIEDTLKSLRPQPQEETKFKVGDRVIIHCRKERPEDIAEIYDGKEGEITAICDEELNPWGHIIVYLKDGCNNSFHKDELEIISSSSWKPSGELLEALHTAAYLPVIKFYGGLKDKLRELYENLKRL